MNSNDTRKEGMQNVKARLGEFIKKWEIKLMHGRYSGIVGRTLVKKVFSYGYKWEIRRQKLTVKKMAAQYLALKAKNHAKKNNKNRSR